MITVVALLVHTFFLFPTQENLQVYAEEVVKPTIYVNETFEKFGSAPPPGWVVYGANENARVVGEKTDEQMGISAKLNVKNQSNYNLNFNYTLPYVISGSIIFEAKVKAESNDLFNPIFQIEDSIKQRTALASLNTDGWIKAGKQKICEYQPKKWYRIACVLNMEKETMDVYINGEKKAEQIPYSDTKQIKDVQIFKFYIKGQQDKDLVVFLDDVRVYEGTEPIQDESIFEEEEEKPVPEGGNNIAYQKMQERMKNAMAFYIGSPYAYVNGTKEKINSKDGSLTPVVRDETVFIPLQWLMTKLDMKYIVNQKENSMTLGKGEEVHLQIKDPKGQVVHTDTTFTEQVRKVSPISSENGILQEEELYVSCDFIQKNLNKEIWKDERGLIVISDQKSLFDQEQEQDLVDEVIKEIIYERPTAEKIIADLKEKNPNKKHPRIFATEDTFEVLKQRIGTDENVQKWYTDLRRQADKVVDSPVGKYELPDGRRMQAARDARPYIEETALMYRLSGEKKYLDRAIAELEAVIAFPDWNHQNEFLNTAEMTAAVAIGYDWLYDELSDELKEKIRQAIVDKGLQKALDAYENRAWWSQPRELINNWNAVCNGGIAMGALAIGDEVEEIAGETLAKAMRSLEDVILMNFSPDGGWGEGPGYWRYTIEYIVSFMATMESALGTTYGHADTPGLKETAYYPLYITGPQGSFNYADASSTKMKMPELFWLAKMLNDPDIAGLRLSLMEEAKQAGSVYDILWYDPGFHNKDAKLSLDKYFRGPEVVTFRNQWNNVYGQFVGFKAGKGYMSHGHLDIGNFVYHANGEQWAIDLGADNYTNKYFNYHTDRFYFYRAKPEGHNTIVINPDGKYQQDHLTFNPIERMETKPKGSFAIADMTEAYAKNAKQAKRGIMLGNNRSMMIVQDEIKTHKPSDIWWFMHTQANIAIGEDGQTAILTQNGQKLWAQIITPDGSKDAKFTVMEAKPFEGEPNPAGQKEIVGIQKLAIHLEKAEEMNLAVALIPLQYQQEEPTMIPTYIPLEQWSIQDGEIDLPVAKEITLDGKAIEDFRPDVYHYDIKLPFGTQKVPEIQGTSDYKMEIIQPKSLLELGQIIVTNPKNDKEVIKYTIRFSILPSNTKPSSSTQFEIKEVKASEFQADGKNYNPPEHSVDKDLNTRWSAEGEQWIQYDLGQIQEVSCVGISFHNGHKRSSIFNIELSLDGQDWEKVYIGSSSGTTSEVEYFGFVEQQARYVRINGNGNSINRWNSYSEVEIYGGGLQ